MIYEVRCGEIVEMVNVPDNSNYASVAADVLKDKDPSFFLPVVVVTNWITGESEPFSLKTIFLMWGLREIYGE